MRRAIGNLFQTLGPASKVGVRSLRNVSINIPSQVKIHNHEKIIQSQRLLYSAIDPISLPQRFPEKLIVCATDFGADLDDQEAVRKLIFLKKKKTEVIFFVTGPEPLLAAMAIGKEHKRQHGYYPYISIGERKSHGESEIYDLWDGEGFLERIITGKIYQSDVTPITHPDAMQQRIDAMVTSGHLKEFEYVILSPINSPPLYNPSQNDPTLEANWKRIKKTATMQFARNQQGNLWGFNSQNSDQKFLKDFLDNLSKHSFEESYFDGAVAKRPEFKLKMKQPKQPGIENGMKNYFLNFQLPWLNCGGNSGVTPTAQEMHLGMFLPLAHFPFISHLSGSNPAGFGRKRLMKEVFGIDEKHPDYAKINAEIEEKLCQLDEIIFAKLHEKYPHSLKDLKELMHEKMMSALQEIAVQKGIITDAEVAQGFAEIYAIAKEKKISMSDFQQSFFDKILSDPLFAHMNEIIVAAQKEKKPNGQSFQDEMLALAEKLDATAVAFDAVAVVVGEVIKSNPELREYFAISQSVVNITNQQVEQLARENAVLYGKFVTEVREILQIGEIAMAVETKNLTASPAEVSKTKLSPEQKNTVQQN